MKTTVLSKCATIVLLMLVFIGGPTTTPGVEVQANTSHAAANDLQAEPPSQGISLTFIENIGQFDAGVHFQASNGNTTLFLTDDALWMSLTDLPAQADPVSEAKVLGAVVGADETGRQVNLKLTFGGANLHPRLEPFDEMDAKVSFLTGADSSRWRADVPAWAGVRYAELYPGIDLEITGQDGQLTPRLVVREPGSLQNVRLRVEGADALAVEGNHLRLTTLLGDFGLPLLTVEGADPKTEPAISVVDGIQQISAPFASTPSLASGMTPTGTPTLRYSTYLGGSGQDQASDIALDSEGNVYIIGRTYSTNLPTTPGAYDISHNGGDEDVFVTKLSADGSRLLYSTYLGGSNYDCGWGIAVDSAGNAYITGHTFSTDFPTTSGAPDTTLSGQRDAFVAKLNAAGDGLAYSTYLGGPSWDYGQSIALDDSGSAYAGGFTHGSFPVTAGAAQTVFGGMGDGFATKLSPDGRTVFYSTYIGGNSWEGADGIAVDHAGHAYVVTGTASTDYPTTPGAYDRTCDNCSTNYSTDAAVAKLNADGSAFIYSTLIGGTDAPASEWFDDIAVDSSGNAYLIGVSSSTDFPTTPHALQPGLGGGQDVVVVKLNAGGSDLLYSTWLGGSGVDRGYGIAIDGNGKAFVTGYTSSTDFPTANPLQAANAGGYDAFLAVVNADASALLYSSYLGGSGNENRDRSSDSTDHCGEIALDRTGQIVYLTGFTDSTDFPTTANAYDRSFNGGASDAFVTGLSVTTGPWHVVTSGSDSTGNGSEARPFATIQHGIDVASHGDTVLVHPGVYRENINFNGKNITVGSLFVTTGYENYILQTVIDGNRNGHVVTFVNGEAASARLSGLTITNGYASATTQPEPRGGGVYCLDANPTLNHLRVTGNEAVFEGGGLYFAHCSPTIRDLAITSNLAGTGGGGIRYSDGSVNLENVVVSHNSARLAGSGMQFYHADGAIKNALIADNSGGGQGGGLQFDGCSPTFTNVTIVGNRTTGHGGGLNVSYMSQPTLVNSIVWGNTPEQIYFDTNWPGEAITIEHSDIEGGEAGIVTNGQGPVHWGDGNLQTPPRFVHAGLGNYRLADNSPAIGAGKADGAPSADIEGNPRPNPAGSKPDMGAYENPLGSPPIFKVYLPFMRNAPRSVEGIYFVRGDVLYQMNLDGSGLRSVADGLQDNQSLAVDPVHRKIYAGRWGQSAQIRVFDVTTGNLDVFSDGPGDGGQGLAIDPASHRMYHGLYYDGVYAMDMNTVGSWTRLVDPASLYPMYGQRGQLQVDLINRHIYFRSTFNGECGLCRYIWRVGFDGDGLIKIIQANGGDALALDLTGLKMYFSDEPDEPASNTVKRANLDGSAVETLLTLPAPYRICTSMALDVEHQKMYLNLSTDGGDGYKGKAIARANMDGSGFEILHTVAGNIESEVHGLMALLLPVAPAPEPPPLVRYDFEGDFLASGTVLDRSGNGHDAQVTGAVASATGISGGQGIAFTGNGYLQAANNPAAGKTNVTFSLWFKTEHPKENYKLASGAWWNWGPGSGWIMATHGPEFWSDDTQGLLLPGQPNNENNFAVSEWIHEVVTYDGSRIKEYTNGQLINDWSTTGAAIGQGNPMVVGAWPPFTGYNFQGSMDEFAIYGRSLTQQEVQALYNQGK